MPPPLIVLCAGDASRHVPNAWHARTPRTAYTLAIVYYGGDAAVAARYAAHADVFVRDTGPKWALVRRFLLAHRSLCAAAPFVAFPDDDLDVTTQQWTTLFAVARTHRLDLFQPALVDNGADYIKHTHLVTQPQNVLRFVNFVEIMTPVFSRRAFAKCTRALCDPQLKSAWGLDYALTHPRARLVPCRRYDLPDNHPRNRDTYNVAVVDSVAIVHTRKLSQVDARTLQSSFYQTYQIDPEQEMRRVLRTYHASQFAPQTLRCVPVAVDYTRRDPHNPKPKAAQRLPLSSIALPAFLQANVQREHKALRDAQQRNAQRAQQHKRAPTRHTRGGRRRRHRQRHHKHPHTNTFTYLPPVYRTVADLPKFYYKIGLGFHADIRDNTLHIVQDFGSYQLRNWKTVQMLHQVLDRYVVPDTSVLVCTDDKPRGTDVHGVPLLVMAKTPSQTYLTYPDHTFYHWHEAHTASWTDECRRIPRTCATTYADVSRKIPRAFFRGNVGTAWLRKYLADVSAKNTGVCRDVLDVADVRVGDAEEEPATRRRTMRKASSHARRTRKQLYPPAPPHGFLSLAEHARYKYLLHIPGISYAGRLKYLLLTNSTVIYVQKAPAYEYREFWYDYLQDGVNCVVVRDPNDGLPKGEYRDADVSRGIADVVKRGRTAVDGGTLGRVLGYEEAVLGYFGAMLAGGG